MQKQPRAPCSPHVTLCVRNFFFPCFSPTRERILSLRCDTNSTDTGLQIKIPGLSFFPAPDSIWMHADAVIGRLVDDVCCSYTSCHGSGTPYATSMCLRAAAALQSMPTFCDYHGAQRRYAMVLTHGGGSCSAKHTGNLRFTAGDRQRSNSSLRMHCNGAAC